MFVAGVAWDGVVQRLPLMSGQVEPQEQAHRELFRFALTQGGMQIILLTAEEKKQFEKGTLYKILRSYLVHNTSDNFVVLVASHGDANLGQGARILGAIFLGPFFSLRDPTYAHLSPWTASEYQGLLEDRRTLMRATLNGEVASKCWASPYFEPKSVDEASFAFRVHMILIFPPPHHEKRVKFEANVCSFKANGQIFNDPFLRDIANLLEKTTYNRYNARPFDAVYGPSPEISVPIPKDKFDYLFFGGAPSMLANTFSQTQRATILVDTFLPAVSSQNFCLRVGRVQLACRYPAVDCSFLVNYLKSKAKECCGGKEPKEPMSTWFGLRMLNHHTYDYRMSTRDVQPNDFVMASLMALATQEANRGQSTVSPFRVDAVEVTMFPLAHNTANIQVHFPFSDGSNNEPFFCDHTRVVLVVFEESAEVEGSQPDTAAPTAGPEFTVPRRDMQDEALQVALSFRAVNKICVGNGEMLVLTGDIASKRFKVFKSKKPMGFRGVFVFHMLNMNTVISTNRCLK